MSPPLVLPSGYLAKNFRAAEFACHHCGLVNVDPLLVYSLQALRDDTDRPIRILSACRCHEHNAAVGGAPASQHLTTPLHPCCAADITIEGLSLRQTYFAACKVSPFMNGGVGLYPDQGFLHVDVRGRRDRWGQIGRARTAFIVAWEYLLEMENAAKGVV